MLFSAPSATPVLLGDGFTGIATGSFGGNGAIKEYSLSSIGGSFDFSEFTSEVGQNGSLILHYQFTVLDDVTDASLGVFMDADINAGYDTYWNETGEVILGPGGATSWEIDEPGYTYGDIYENFTNGAFDNSTLFATGIDREDVSFGLGFDIGRLVTGDLVTIEIALSETALSGNEWGTILHQWDVDAGINGDNLFMAGRFSIVQNEPANVPEPSSISFLMFSGALFSGLLLTKRKNGRK